MEAKAKHPRPFRQGFAALAVTAWAVSLWISLYDRGWWILVAVGVTVWAVEEVIEWMDEIDKARYGKEL